MKSRELTDRQHGSPAKELTNSGPEVWEVIPIFEGGYAGTTNDSIKFFLALLLLIWMGYHREHKPGQSCTGLRGVRISQVQDKGAEFKILFHIPQN
jgi:hypothetical protein